MFDPDELKAQQIALYEDFLNSLREEVGNTKDKHPTLDTSNAYKEVMGKISEIQHAINAMKNENNPENYLQKVEETNLKCREMQQLVATKLQNPPGFMGIGQRSAGATALYESLNTKILKNLKFDQTKSSAVSKTIPAATKMPIEDEVKVTILGTNEPVNNSGNASPTLSKNLKPASITKAPDPTRETFTATHLRLAEAAHREAYRDAYTIHGKKPEKPTPLQAASEAYLNAAKTHIKADTTDEDWEKSATAVYEAHEKLKTQAEGSPAIEMLLNAQSKKLGELATKVLPGIKKGNEPKI
jgi:hypothetical protein